MRLSNENIDATILQIQRFFEDLKVSNADKMKICILLEESLLRYQEKFGAEHEFNFITKKWFGTPKVIIRIKGTAYNPIEDDSDDNIFSKSVMQNLLNYEGAGTVYRYENGYNEVSAFSTKAVKKLKIPGGSLTISILLAFLAALIVQQLPLPVQKILVDSIAAPILDKMLGMIIAFSIPMIFICIAASICSIEDVTVLNAVGAKILGRFLKLMTSIVVVSIAVNSIFFPVVDFNSHGDFLTGNALEFGKIFELLLNIFPQNIVAPFLSGNVLQIVVLALLTGTVVTMLGRRVDNFKEFIMSLKQIIFKIVDIVFLTTPLIIFLCIFKTIMTGSFAQILSVWKIVACNYSLYIIIGGIMLLLVKMRYGVKITDFLKKLTPAFLITFTTGSGSAAMPKNIEICKNDLNIDKNLCDFYIPLSHPLCPTTANIGIITCVFFAAEFSNVPISIANLIIIVFLSIQFSISSSSGNGGMLAILGLLFTQLNLPLDALGTIMIADIFIVNVSGVVSLIIRDCDLINASHEIKFDSR